MRVRRCAVVYLEPRESVEIDLADLCAGGSGASRTRRWVALAPHLDSECVLTEAEVLVLGRLSPSQWQDGNAVGEAAAVQSLVEKGLLLADDSSAHLAQQRDAVQRKSQWHPLAATYHAFTRWNDVDSAQAAKDAGAETAAALLKTFGPPPPSRSCGARPGRSACPAPPPATWTPCYADVRRAEILMPTHAWSMQFLQGSWSGHLLQMLCWKQMQRPFS